MSPGINVVKRIEHNLEAREPLDAVLLVFDVSVVRDQFCPGVEFLSHLFRDLCLGLLDMLMSEEELTIEIAEIYRVKIDDVDFAKA